MKISLEISPKLGLLCIYPGIHEDHRGTYVESFNEEMYYGMVIGNRIGNSKFVQDDFSWSRKNVLRGLHGDASTFKLVSCPYGSIYLMVLCLDGSDKNGQWESFILNDRQYLQVLVPPSHANGHLVLSDSALFHYKQTEYYNRSGQFSIKWDDPQYGMFWPIINPILSIRDSHVN